MANYQTRFDEVAGEARRVFVEHGEAIRDLVPGLWGRDLDRLVTSISKLLEKVDKRNVDHPEYLAHSSGNIAEHAVQLLQGMPSSIQSGASHFIQTTLPALVACEERLLKAVGKYFFQVREVKDRQVREIQKLAAESVEFREGAREAGEAADEFQKQAAAIIADLKSKEADAASVSSKITEIRDFVQKLASGDGRGKSLESLKRAAEAKVEAIDSVLKKSTVAAEKVELSASALEAVSKTADETKQEIDSIRSQAEAVLNLSSQAGLARSYLKESRDLAIKSYIYTGILYITSIATAVIAAFYVLPSLEYSITANGGTLTQRAIPLTLLRATVLAPLVYVLYFTTRQISSIETLRMDYAEKAAASLAYSGYKDEMSEDRTLLDRLRGSLLLKFAEHPERLLRKRPVRDTIEVEAPGFRATSRSAEVPAVSEGAASKEA